MPEFAEYARWYYAIYLLPGGLALFLLLASSLGHGMHHGDHADAGHADAGHADAGHADSGHTDNDTAPHGAGPGHLRVGMRADHGRHSSRGTPAAHNKAPFLATFFGIGRVPLLLVWGSALLGNLGKLVTPAIEKLTGQSGTTADQSDAIARALAANPQALQAIADALAADDKANKAAVPVVPPVPVVPAVPAAVPVTSREGNHARKAG